MAEEKMITTNEKGIIEYLENNPNISNETAIRILESQLKVLKEHTAHYRGRNKEGYDDYEKFLNLLIEDYKQDSISVRHKVYLQDQMLKIIREKKKTINKDKAEELITNILGTASLVAGAILIGKYLGIGNNSKTGF